MAQTTAHQHHDAFDGIVRPRPVKPGNPMVLRAQSEEDGLKPNGLPGLPSGISR